MGIKGIFIASNLVVATQLSAVEESLVWRWSNPRPHGNNIIDMAFQEGRAVQVAERGQIYTSDDLVTWIPRESHTRKALRSVTFFQDRIVITGQEGIVLYSDDAVVFADLDLQSLNWLEGVAASDSLLVAVGDAGTVYTSSDAVNWQLQATPFEDWLRDVVFGNGLFVTIGEDGLLATSSDGVMWTQISLGSADNLNQATWTGTAFFVVGDNGVAFTSADGINWQSIDIGSINTLNTIAANGTTHVAAGVQTIQLQEAPAPWSNQLDLVKAFPAPSWTYLSSIWTGESFLLGGRTGMIVEGSKPTGNLDYDWRQTSDTFRNWLWDVKRFENVYIAVGDQATVMTSQSGVDWDVELVPESLQTNIFFGIGGRADLALAVGNEGAMMISPNELVDVVSTNQTTGEISTNQVSRLGVFWTAIEPRPTTADLQGVTDHGDQLVVTGADGTLLTSTDAENWTLQNTSSTSFLSGIASFPGGLVAVGDNGTLLTSPDASTWTSINSGTTNWLSKVRYLNNQLLAVGQNGTILTSPGGIAWTQQISGTTNWLNDVHQVADTYYVVGNQGTVLSSSNSVDWTNIGTITGKSLYAAASNQGRLVAVGIEGVILRSQITPRLDPIKIIDYAHDNVEGVGVDSFLFSGHTDQRFTLDSSSDLGSWQTGPQLEILSADGTLIHITENQTPPSTRFYRPTLVP